MIEYIEILMLLIVISQSFCYYAIYKVNDKINQQNKNLNIALSDINKTLEKSNEYLMIIARNKGYI